MNQILQNKPMTVFGVGSQTRAFSYIGDIVPIMAEAVEVPAARNQVFNVGADQPYSVNELATFTAQSMGVESDIIRLPPRNEVLNAYSSHEKVERVFGKRKLHSLETGLGQMAAWVKQHGARASKEFDKIEVRKNLPETWLV